MVKKNISSLELAALVNEFQFLAKGKISQIYHQEKKELLFQLHAPGKGKQLLKIIPGKFLCLTSKKETPLNPTGFCMQLRKYLNNGFIKSITQKNSERIIVFEIEKKEGYFLIIELFSKGNIILTDREFIIITTLERQIWKDRSVKPGEKYVFPKSEVDWAEIKERELYDLLQKSEKKNLAVSLATEVGLGGLYAEEVCLRSGIDKEKMPKEITEKELKVTIKILKEFMELIKEPKGLMYEEEITPFPLQGRSVLEEKKTYSEALDTLNPHIIISPYEKRIKAIEKTIETQLEAIKELEGKIVLNTKKGELIYEKYSPLQKLLSIVENLKKTKTWGEIGKELKKEQKIKRVDLKTKKVTIDL